MLHYYRYLCLCVLFIVHIIRVKNEHSNLYLYYSWQTEHKLHLTLEKLLRDKSKLKNVLLSKQFK